VHRDIETDGAIDIPIFLSMDVVFMLHTTAYIQLSNDNCQFCQSDRFVTSALMSMLT